MTASPVHDPLVVELRQGASRRDVGFAVRVACENAIKRIEQDAATITALQREIVMLREALRVIEGDHVEVDPTLLEAEPGGSTFFRLMVEPAQKHARAALSAARQPRGEGGA